MGFSIYPHPRKSGSRSRGPRGARGAVLGTLWRRFWHLLSRKWALCCRPQANANLTMPSISYALGLAHAAPHDTSLSRRRSRFASPAFWDVSTGELLRVVAEEWPDLWAVAARISARPPTHNLRRSPNTEEGAYEHGEATSRPCVRLNGSTYHSISSSSPPTIELICLRWVSGATKSKYVISMWSVCDQYMICQRSR
jgi:hypothetical protein